MIIPEIPRPTPRRFTIVHASVQIGPIELAPGNTVTVGTPIRPGKGGWEVARDGKDIWAYVGSTPTGFNPVVDAWREVTAEVGQIGYSSGACLSIKFVNDDGLASQVPDPDGHVATIGRTRLFFTATGPAPAVAVVAVPTLEEVTENAEN
jgi:hypothetical protein